MKKKLPATSSKPAAEKLKTILAEAKPPRALVLIAPDRIRKARFLEKFLEKFLSASGDTVALIRLSGHTSNESDVDKALTESTMGSLFSPRSCIVMTHAQEFSQSTQKKILAGMENVSADSVVLILAESLTSQSPLRKIAAKSDYLIELDEFDGPAAAAWVKRELTRAGIRSFPQQLHGILADAAQNSADDISSMIEHLALYTDNGEVRAEDFFQLFRQRIDPSEFALVDALIQGNGTRAETLMSSLFASGKAAFPLLALVAKTYASAFAIKDLTVKGHADKDIAGLLGISPWIIGKRAPLARKRSFQSLGTHLKSILTTDSKLKNKSLGPEIVFSELIQALSPSAS